MRPDAVIAVREYLLDVIGLTEDRIYGVKIPAIELAAMPTYCVLIRDTGGEGSRGLLAINKPILEIISFGKTPLEAHEMHSIVADAMKALCRAIYGGALLHNAVELGGPVALEDPETNWPYIRSGWTITISEITIEED